MSTQAVLDHHLGSFGAGDVDATMEDYTDDSILVLTDATLTGRDAIRAAAPTASPGAETAPPHSRRGHQ